MGFIFGRHEKNKRSGPDFWVKSLTWFSVIAWGLMFLAFVFLCQAKPASEDFFDRFNNVKDEVRINWDAVKIKYLFNTLVAGLIISGVGLFVNSRRHKRVTDEYRLSLIIVGFISLIGIFMYLIMIR